MSARGPVLLVVLAACGADPEAAPALAGVGAAPSGSAGPCIPGQRVLGREVRNARDLGAVPLASGAVACGRLYRGPALPGMSSSGCAEVAQLGWRTVIDLREPAERGSAPDAACVSAQARSVLAPMPIPYSVSPADYLADLDSTEAVRASLEAIALPDALPAYFHCTYGRDRSGVLAAVLLRVLGASREEVLTDYQRSAAAGLSTTPGSLMAVLDALDDRGGVEVYLRAAGVSDSTLEALRRGLIVPR